MSERTHQPITHLDVVLDNDLGAPARVLDLFTAQAAQPEEFAFLRDGEHLRLRVLTPAMAATRYSILLAKLRVSDGVRSVEVGPRPTVHADPC